MQGGSLELLALIALDKGLNSSSIHSGRIRSEHLLAWYVQDHQQWEAIRQFGKVAQGGGNVIIVIIRGNRVEEAKFSIAILLLAITEVLLCNRYKCLLGIFPTIIWWCACMCICVCVKLLPPFCAMFYL